MPLTVDNLTFKLIFTVFLPDWVEYLLSYFHLPGIRAQDVSRALDSIYRCYVKTRNECVFTCFMSGLLHKF